MSQHQAKFTWGAGPNVVTVAGNFNSWSADATPLHKQEDGSFAADISLPWGEKQAFKYVVDGEWKVREDEAKEWDAAGNMNNVYTAPHAPAATSAPAHPVPAAADSPAVPVVAAASTKEDAKPKEEAVKPSADETTPKAAPVAAAPEPAAATTTTTTTTDTTPAPTASKPTEASTLLASSAPAPASSGNPYNLGKPIGAGESKPATTSTLTNAEGAEPVKATAAVPVAAAPAVTDPTPVQIEKTAANANIGAVPAQTDDEKTIQETVAEYGAGAFAAIGAVAGGALAAVEKATGVDLTHGNPLSVEEAKAQGINVNNIEKKELDTSAISPVGTKPPLSAVDALEEKVQELKKPVGETANGPSTTAKVPLPNGEAPKSSHANVPEPLSSEPQEYSKHDIPAQDEVDNHQHVPATVITPVSAKDPRKDRSVDAANNTDTAGTKPISADPSISAKDAKREAEEHPGGTGSTPDAAQGKVTAAPTPAAGGAAHIGPGEATARPDARNANDVTSPPTPAKDSTPSAPATPAKSAAAAAPGSVNSTPASTPAKSAHAKEGTTGSAHSDVRKRKSSFFTKIKSAFSPKDKEKK